MLDTGAHFYDVYETADGQYVSIGSIEPQFYAELLRLTGLEGEELPWQHDRAPVAGAEGEARGDLPHARPATSGARSWRAPTSASPRCCRCPRRSSTRTTSARGTFVEVAGVKQPAPAPRFSRTPAGRADPARARRPAHRRRAGRRRLRRRAHRQAAGLGGRRLAPTGVGRPSCPVGGAVQVLHEGVRLGEPVAHLVGEVVGAAQVHDVVHPRPGVVRLAGDQRVRTPGGGAGTTSPPTGSSAAAPRSCPTP